MLPCPPDRRGPVLPMVDRILVYTTKKTDWAPGAKNRWEINEGMRALLTINEGIQALGHDETAATVTVTGNDGNVYSWSEGCAEFLCVRKMFCAPTCVYS